MLVRRVQQPNRYERNTIVLTQIQIDEFHRDGFLVLPALFDGRRDRSSTRGRGRGASRRRERRRVRATAIARSTGNAVTTAPTASGTATARFARRPSSRNSLAAVGQLRRPSVSAVQRLDRRQAPGLRRPDRVAPGSALLRPCDRVQPDLRDPKLRCRHLPGRRRPRNRVACSDYLRIISSAASISTASKKTTSMQRADVVALELAARGRALPCALCSARFAREQGRNDQARLLRPLHGEGSPRALLRRSGREGAASLPKASRSRGSMIAERGGADRAGGRRVDPRKDSSSAASPSRPPRHWRAAIDEMTRRRAAREADARRLATRARRACGSRGTGGAATGPSSNGSPVRDLPLPELAGERAAHIGAARCSLPDCAARTGPRSRS